MLFFVTFSFILRLSCDQPVVSGVGNRSTWQKPPSRTKSLAIFSHARKKQKVKGKVIGIDTKNVKLRRNMLEVYL